MRTPFAHPMFSLACVVSLALLACGGSEPQGAGASGVAQSSSGGTGTSPGASSSSGGSSSGGGSSSSGETGGHVGIGIGGGSSGSGELDSGTQLSCSTMLPAPQATSVVCNSDELFVNDGGVAAEGIYVVSGWWRCSGFNRVIGSARVYRENGVLAMRFELAKGAADASEDIIEQFTWQLDLGGDASVTRTSVCRDTGMKAIVNVGSYSATSSTLTFHFTDHDERWTRVADL